MPKVYLTKRSKQYDELIDSIGLQRRIANVTISALAKKVSMSKSTLYNRMNNPGAFTLDEIWAIMEVLKLTDEQKRRALP